MSLSQVWCFATPWTIVCQLPLSMEFSRQEYWSALPSPPSGDRPNSGTEPASPAMAGKFFTTEPLGMLNMPYTYRSCSPFQATVSSFLFALCSVFLSRIPSHSRSKSYSMLYFLPPALTTMLGTEVFWKYIDLIK